MTNTIKPVTAALYMAGFIAMAGSTVTEAATPKASFGSSLITGTDNRISVTRVPVINSAGQVSYQDVTINFVESSTGVITMAPLNPIITASPSLITSGFKAGNYKDSLGNKYTVTGPSVIPGTTRTNWSMVFTSGPDATQFSMAWVTGPIAGHPNQSSLTTRSITSAAYSWGIVGSETAISGSFPFWAWGNNAYVVGAAQAGNQLVLHVFRGNDNIEDGNVSLTLCPTTC